MCGAGPCCEGRKEAEHAGDARWIINLERARCASRHNPDSFFFSRWMSRSFKGAASASKEGFPL